MRRFSLNKETETLEKRTPNLARSWLEIAPREFRPKVIDAARKALELDPELAEAHVLLGNIY